MEKIIYETNIEKLFRKELECRGLRTGIDFAIQFPLRYSFILDIAFPNYMLAIELDGEAYHPTQRDVIKDKILKKLGWKVIRFWGREIEEDVVGCVNKILTLISEKANVAKT